MKLYFLIKINEKNKTKIEKEQKELENKFDLVKTVMKDRENIEIEKNKVYEENAKIRN